MSGSFSTIPNFTGVNAGQQFRQAVNAALGGSATITPVLGPATAAAGVNLSAATAAANITNAALRTLAAWKTDAVNFADYSGADPTGTNDNSSLMAQALADARRLGKTLYFPSGVWGYSNPTTIQQGDRIVGADRNTTQFLYIGPTTSGSSPTLFTTGSMPSGAPVPSAEPETIFASFRVTGPWNGTTVTYANGMSGQLIVAQPLDSVLFSNLTVECATNEGIEASFCRHVALIECLLQYCSRDSANFSGTSFVSIIGNSIRHGDDNALSGHANWGQAWGIVSDLVIIGNRIEDCPGISFQGAKRALITGNILSRMRASGIEIAFVGTNLAEGETPPIAVEISGNVITDVINAYGLNGQDPEGHYIVLGTVPPRAGSANGVPASNLTIMPYWWAPDTPVPSGIEIVDPNGSVQKTTTAGTTGASAPSWNEALNGTTSDGTAVWTNEGSGLVAARYPAATYAWAASTAYAIGAIVVDVNGNVQSMTATSATSPATSGTSGASAPTWSSTYGDTTSDGECTWTCKGANTTNAVVLPYLYANAMRQNASDTTTTLAPAMGISVTGNRIQRTTDYTANLSYSALGYGKMFNRYGWIDGKLGQEELVAGVAGVDTFSYQNNPISLVNLRVRDNDIIGMGNAVHIGNGIQLLESEVSGNRITDFLNSAIAFATASAPHDLLISGNFINGDPYAQLRGSGTEGKWQSGVTYPAAFSPDGASGVLIERNYIRNVYQITNGSWGNALFTGNIAYCNPVAIGYNPGNVGIGNVPAAGPAFVHMIMDGNPASGTFRNLLGTPVLGASAMPSSGTFVAGQMVWNTSPSVTSGYTLLGWVRLTTGSSNVSGTDWQPVFAPVSS